MSHQTWSLERNPEKGVRYAVKLWPTGAHKRAGMRYRMLRGEWQQSGHEGRDAYLASNTRDVIRRDLEADFQRDDEARAGDMFRPLGADCDREQWERVRALWAIAEESSND